jgi:glycosyltransferase involved in cell wall biosynthesis
VEEHNDPAHERVGRPWGTLRRLAYRRASAVVTLTEQALAYFDPPIKRRGWVIPNPVVLPAGAGVDRDHEPSTSVAGLPAGADPTIISMGRLVPQKGFDLLLDAFSRVDPVRHGWTLEIRGEGPGREELEGLRDRLGLANVVRMPGVTDQPAAVLGRAGLFVLSSRYEGFPTVLGEAMAIGLPVISFDCPTGPREMIRDGVDGILVPAGDVVALAEAIRDLLDDGDRRTSLAARAPEIVDRFGLERIRGRWDRLFADVTAGGRP